MISVIVPVYKVEKFITPCVESILAQTCCDIEIILVDDGSPDSCPALCDACGEKYSNVQVVHKQNGGLMSAWKAGMDKAKGDYIGFVDSDDWIDTDMFAALYDKAKTTGADMVVCGYIREYADRTEKEKIFPDEGLYNRGEIETQIFPRLISMGTMLDRFISPNRVTKLFKKSLLLQNLKYCSDDISLGEDFVTTFPCICDAEKIYVFKDFHPYHYRIHDTSIMGSYNAGFYNDSLKLNRHLADIAAEKQVYDFTNQLSDDLISLAFYGIEKCIASGAPRKTCTDYIKKTLSNPDFKTAFKKQRITRNSMKCRIYGVLCRLGFKYGLYLFIKYAVFFKRKHLGV